MGLVVGGGGAFCVVQPPSAPARSPTATADRWIESLVIHSSSELGESS
jgi:hypothetical protein